MSEEVSGEEVHEWSAYYDGNGQIYYFNSVTNESSWDPPEKFNPPPPQEGEEPEQEQPTKEEPPQEESAEAFSSSPPPANEPEAFSTTPPHEPEETKRSPEYQEPDSQLQEPPEEATAGPWAAYQDDSGQTYYYNSETGETQWEVPENFSAAPAEPTDVSPQREGTPPPGSSPTGTGTPEETATKQEPEPEPEPEPEIDPAQKRLEDAEKALNEPDAIMEPACLDNVGELLSSLGGQGGQKAMQALISSFHGQTAICGLLSLWLSDLKSSSSAENTKEASVKSSQEVREITQDVVTRIAKERFTKAGGDNIFKLKKSEAVFLEDMMDSERWRKLLIDLSAANRDSTLLNYCLSSISKRGHHREIAKRINQSDHFAVYSAMLASEFAVVGNIAAGASIDLDSSMGLYELVDDLRRTCTSTSYTYLYAVELLRYLVQIAREKAADAGKHSRLHQSVRKWERLREELESAMVDPSMSTSTAGSSTLFRKRRLDVALTVSELHQRQRRRLDPTVSADGAERNTDPHRDSLETALAVLFRFNASGTQVDDATLDKLLPGDGDDGSEVGKLMMAYPLAVRILLGHLFKPGSGRVSSMLTRTKCARLIALSVLAAETATQAEIGSVKEEDQEARATEEEEIKGMLLTGSQMCELVENMVSFTVTSDVNNNDPNPSAGMKLSKLALKSAPVAQGVVMWARELVGEPDFVNSASYATLSSSILSLVRIIVLKHPFSRPSILGLALAILKHSNSEVTYTRMKALKEQCLRLLLFLLVQGEVSTVLSNLTARLNQQGSSEIDASLVRYFVGGLLEVIRPPYSPLMVQSLGAFLLATKCTEALGSSYFSKENKARCCQLVQDFRKSPKREGNAQLIASLAKYYE